MKVHLVETECNVEFLLQSMFHDSLRVQHDTFRDVHHYHHSVAQSERRRQLVREIHMTWNVGVKGLKVEVIMT